MTKKRKGFLMSIEWRKWFNKILHPKKNRVFGRKKGAVTEHKSKDMDKSTHSKSDSDGISIREFKRNRKPINCSFPGPRGQSVPLRIAMERTPYADLSTHAKDSLDSEVCGVLVGNVCSDDEGLFIHVKHTIRGVTNQKGRAHVTFTQETWNSIHAALEKDYPKMQIVGWYHSHPGFGVKFSEMDIFIQKNFFSHPSQIALLIDPLGGDMAVCANTGEGFQYVKKFWVDGREQKCYVPKEIPIGKDFEPKEQSDEIHRALESVEARLNMLIKVVDDYHTGLSRYIIVLGMIVCVGIISLIGYYIFGLYSAKYSPPVIRNYLPFPVQLGDKRIFLGVGLFEWEVPKELYSQPEDETKDQLSDKDMDQNSEVVQEHSVAEDITNESKSGTKRHAKGLERKNDKADILSEVSKTPGN